jgi:hypothetical protein
MERRTRAELAGRVFPLTTRPQHEEDAVEAGAMWERGSAERANSIGGDILYGVREGRDESGNTLAVAVDGVAGVDADAAILRLENFIRNSIKLRLIGLQIGPSSLI